jgi:hypothetical protein
MDFNSFKKTWESVTTGIFEFHPQHRIGDEIQLTAFYKYIRSKNINIDYKDCNPFISTLNIFPDNLVRFVESSSYPTINFINLWVWSPYLRHEGFYTESQQTHNLKNTEYDIVFIPCLSPDYNEQRGIKNAEEIFTEIKKHYKNCICIIDKNKKHLYRDNDSNVFFSDNIYTTFKIIDKSKIYIGCDTGTSHYAGSINHPNMFLLYPDETEVQNRISWQKEIIDHIFNVPEILRHKPSTIPCCNPKNMSILTIDGKIDPKILLRHLVNKVC